MFFSRVFEYWKRIFSQVFKYPKRLFLFGSCIVVCMYLSTCHFHEFVFPFDATLSLLSPSLEPSFLESSIPWVTPISVVPIGSRPSITLTPAPCMDFSPLEAASPTVKVECVSPSSPVPPIEPLISDSPSPLVQLDHHHLVKQFLLYTFAWNFWEP